MTDHPRAFLCKAVRRPPPDAARFFCPVRQAKFFRRVLRMGCRTIRVWTLMTLGPYEPPREVWMPSVLWVTVTCNGDGAVTIDELLTGVSEGKSRDRRRFSAHRTEKTLTD
jgi:hypothetical protein